LQDRQKENALGSTEEFRSRSDTLRQV